MENNIVDKTINHKCSMCGGCCSFVIPLTKKEVNVIKDYVIKNNIKPEPHQYEDKPGTFDSRCCFLDRKTMKCKIQEVKPFVCRDFKCDHKDWKQRRLSYDKRAYYNSLENKIIIASFDDLIYDDIRPLMTYLLDSYYRELQAKNLEPDTDTLIPFLKKCGREDVIPYMTFFNSDGNTISGKDLI